MKNSITFFISLFLLYMSIKLPAQNADSLVYNNFIQQVLENHPLSARAANSKRYGDLQLRAARGNYDPVLNGSYRQKYYNQTDYYSFFSGDIKQPIFTSQYLKLGYDYGTGPFLNPENSTPVQGLPFLGVEVAVLQGLAIDKRRAETLKAREYIDYYDADRSQQLNELLFHASSSYFEWLYQARSLSLNTYFLDLARERLNAVQQLATIGERPALDTVEAGILYQTRLLELQETQIQFQKSNNQLAQFLWRENKPLELQQVSIPADSLESVFTGIKDLLGRTVYTETAANPVIRKYEAMTRVLNIESRYRRELIKPVLNINYNMLNPDAADGPAIFSNNNYKWGFELAFPLLFRNPNNAYKMAKLSANNNELETKNKNNELVFKRNALKQNLDLISQQLINAGKNARFSKQMLEGEQLKFSIGESSLFLLNTRENKWLEAELKLAEYRLKFMQTVLELIYLNGDLKYSF